MNPQEILLSLTVEYGGDWNEVYDAIKNKKIPKSPIEMNGFEQKYITIIDETYPEELKNSVRPPIVLFYEGDFNVYKEAKGKIALLNDNTATEYSIKETLKIAKELVNDYTFIIPLGQKNNNYIIKELLAKGSRIIAILNTGIGEENAVDKELYRELKEHQLLIGVYPPNVRNKPKHGELSASNIQAVLADKILIGAVSKKSPFMVAVGIAAGIGKTIYCIPHLSGSNYANNTLVKEGACLAEFGEDIE